jgi:hypothetical protein
MARDVVAPTVGEHGEERHPSWVLIGASRVSHSPPGAVLFDSDVRHAHYVVVRLRRASRRRDLNHDWKMGDVDTLFEVAMSESQWASFVSSMNTGDGVPATLTRDGTKEFAERDVPGEPYSPRLKESMREVHEAADRMLAEVREAFEKVKEKPTKANIRNLEIKLQNATPNVDFAAKMLGEHAENVVNRARADIEAVVAGKARQLGVDPADLGRVPALTAGDDD